MVFRQQPKSIWAPQSHDGCGRGRGRRGLHREHVPPLSADSRPSELVGRIAASVAAEVAHARLCLSDGALLFASGPFGAGAGSGSGGNGGVTALDIGPCDWGNLLGELGNTAASSGVAARQRRNVGLARLPQIPGIGPRGVDGHLLQRRRWSQPASIRRQQRGLGSVRGCAALCSGRSLRSRGNGGRCGISGRMGGAQGVSRVPSLTGSAIAFVARIG
mmetsp:Transcript_126942/g.365115  ORF Transcript_126942/g.365115 Transcript_126942/m.365115 type:complete len:218 (-) Transcript_126942:568-1221(-)